MAQSFYAAAAATLQRAEELGDWDGEFAEALPRHDQAVLGPSLRLAPEPALDPPAARGSTGGPCLELEQFIQVSRRELDDEALALLRSLTPEEQRRVIEAGSLSGCRNALAVIRSRVRSAKGGLPPGVGGGLLGEGDAARAAFLRANREYLNPESERLLLSLGPAEVQYVIAGGSLSSCRDPVAVIKSRLRSLREPPAFRGEVLKLARPGDDLVLTGGDPWSGFRPGAADGPAAARAADGLQARLGPGADAGAGVAAAQARGRSARRAGRGDNDDAADAGGDAWGEFRARAEERGGVPLAPPVVPRLRAASAPPKPQLRTGHIPVLLQETLDALLAPGLPGVYVDGTFGRGGHSTEILKRLPPGGRLVAFDVDPSAIAVGRELEQLDPRFTIVHRPFGDIAEVLKGERLAGAMIDIGFSSPQVDQQHRGFSVVEDGPLDLRMNPECGAPFSEWLRRARPEEVAWIIREWGEDDDPIMALRIAHAVTERQRQHGPYTSTLDIAEVIRQVKMGQDDRGQHPAKLSFQGFRVFINSEMEQLNAFMHGALPILQLGGRAVVITFKRPEAALVKQFLREHEEPCPHLLQLLGRERLAELYPLLRTDKAYAVRQARPALVPTSAEVAINRRSRSSMVHVLERVDRVTPVVDRQAAAGVPHRPIQQLFRRPMGVWAPRGQAPNLARLPPRTSGALCSSVLGCA